MKLDALLENAKSGAAWVWTQLGEFAELLKHSKVARARAQVAIAVCIVACGRTSPTANAPDSSKPVPSTVAASDGGEGPREAHEAMDELWSRAAEGAEEDVIRLARTLGPTGLADGATTKETNRLAAKAMAYTEGLAGLAWLADKAAGEDTELALEAAESAVRLAARGRDQNDPEDVEEMREGCKKLLAVSKGSAPKPLKIKAIRAMRLLADRGCQKVEDIPKDFDLAP